MNCERRTRRVSGWTVLVFLFAAVGTGSPARSAEDGLPGDAEKAGRLQSAKNVHQLALAMRNYAHPHLPAAAIKDKNGKALLSWRVEILPFVGEKKLYQQFRLHEPWDSAHNKKLLAKMPKLFAPVMGKPKEPHSTYYQVFTGDGAFGGASGPILPGSFPDGLANTILIIEGGEAVPWTKPADLDYKAKMAIPKLGGLFKEGFHAATADATVFFIKRKKITDATLRAAITPAGNDTLGDDWSEARKP